MYIRPSDRFILIAFYSALSQLESPLPSEIRDSLHTLTSSIAEDPKNIGKLDAIAERYQPLDNIYQRERTRFEEDLKGQERGRSRPPLPLPNQINTSELLNMSIDTFGSSDAVSEAAKNKRIIERIWQSMRGSAGE